MSLFKKSAGRRYKSAEKKIYKINRQLEKIDHKFDPNSEKKEERLNKKLSAARASRRVAELQLKNPPTVNKTYKTTVKVSKKKSAELHVHVGNRKKSK